MKSHAYGLEGIFARGPFKIQGEFSNSKHKGSYDISSALGQTTMDLKAKTYYVEALWLVTGERYSDSYKKGVFGSIKPKNNFDVDGGSGWGALEAGLRFEAYDVTDGNSSAPLGGTNGISGKDGFGTRFQGSMNCATGDAVANDGLAQVAGAVAATNVNPQGCKSGAKTYTAGLKWILNPNVQFKLNYMHTRFDDPWIHYDVNGRGSSAATSTEYIKKEDLVMFRTQYAF
jgi:phosphate-selective porin OprO/OprP